MIPETNSYTNRKQIIEAWGEYVKEKMDAGWEGYLITLKFKHIPGSEKKRLQIMTHELERVYATLLTRLFRRPHAAANRGKLPIWIASPDYPVAKHEKQLLREVTVNNGLHLHGAALFHPEKRLKASIGEHFDNFMHIYVHGDHELSWIDLTPIETEEKYVVGYGFKTIQRRASIGIDGFIVLPRLSSEVRDSRPQAIRSHSATI